MLGPPLTVAEAEMFENLVVPRYLSFFGTLAVDLFLPCPSARIAHPGCRTGYPDALLAEKAPQCVIEGIDASPPALDMARAKAALMTETHASYVIGDALPTPLADDAFTHAIAVHPICDTEARGQLLRELRRVLVGGGQALLALPLRGSFPEINDMVREFALRQDLADLGKAVDTAAASRPTIETISEELEDAGLTEVDVDVQLIAVSFSNGREFLDDPIARLLVFPEIRSLLSLDKEIAGPCMRYVQDAILKYWSEGVFELTVNVGCASGRKLG